MVGGGRWGAGVGGGEACSDIHVTECCWHRCVLYHIVLLQHSRTDFGTDHLLFVRKQSAELDI